MYYADSLGFLGLPGQPMTVENGLKLDLVHLTAAKPWLASRSAIRRDIREFKKQIAEQPRLQLVTSARDLDACSVAGKTAVVLGLQNLPKFPLHEVAVFTFIQQLWRAGIRIVAPTYRDENQFGGGWANPGVGAPRHSREVDQLCDHPDHELIIDLSHLSHATARDFLKITQGSRVMASHGGCYGAYHHIRNLPDDVLRGIAERGGFVGIATLTFILDERDDSREPFLRHLRHAIDVCGEDAVGIGSDGYYVHEDVTAARERFEALRAKLDPDGLLGARYPEHPYVFQGPDRMLRIEAALDRFPSALRERILGGNFRRFLQENLP